VQPRHRRVLPPRAAVGAERRQDRLEVRGDGRVQLRRAGPRWDSEYSHTVKKGCGGPSLVL
jgi:hypothetical protein